MIECPWREVEQDSRKANFHCCVDQMPGYIEPDRKEKRTYMEMSTKVTSLRPRAKKPGKGVKSSEKGKGKAMEVDT